MEQPKESDGNVALYTNGNKKGDSKKQNYKKFKGNCNYCRIQGHKLADCNRCKAAEKNDRAGANLADKQSGDGNDQKKCFRCKEKGHIVINCPNRKKDQADTFFVRVTLSNEATEIVQQRPSKQHKQSREEQIENLSADAQLQHMVCLETLPTNRRWKKHVNTMVIQDHRDYLAINVE